MRVVSVIDAPEENIATPRCDKGQKKGGRASATMPGERGRAGGAADRHTKRGDCHAALDAMRNDGGGCLTLPSA